jgi:phosphatidylserine/phosphatidylglycerophosphate/cardiolipin synthase-like enzyme
VRLQDWFLTPAERGNEGTSVDRRHDDGAAWSVGNSVVPLVHGSTYFAALLQAVRDMTTGDLLLFTDWRGDPDELLDGPGTEVASVLSDAARRGVVVKGLIWRSHMDRLRFSERENRHLGEDIEAAGGECLLDMRVRAGGSHHQKLVVVRRVGRSDSDVAFVGGIDLCHSRRDDARHLGDPQAQPMAKVYGTRPPWHDVQAAIRGPAVGDIEATFRERWEDPHPLSRNPLHRLGDLLRGDDAKAGPLPPQLPDPPSHGGCSVQVLRTYPRRRSAYAFAPNGERSVAHAYLKALNRARRLIYLEDQFLWSREVAEAFAGALAAHEDLRLIAVVPMVPDDDGRFAEPPYQAGRQQAVELLHQAAADRVALFALENEQGTPIYVHAKVCVVDDVWATIGSDNVNRRSWTYDSELSVAVLDEERDDRPPVDPGGLGDGARSFARSLRLRLACEHLGRASEDVDDLLEPDGAFGAFQLSARRLEAWHSDGRPGERPPGRLRIAETKALSSLTRAWATPLYRVLYDPDGRSRADRRSGRF